MESLATGMRDFIRREKLVSSGQRVLLAVSGGIDSMVMAQLFHETGLLFGVAHVNFSLRGEESDLDEAFVRKWAGKRKLPFHSIVADTKQYASLHKCSIQEAAREIRYRWLDRVANDDGYDVIATAHHLDDSIETFFINLLRGTGIHGLSGIPVRNGNIIRPLLFTERIAIERFARSKRLKWREDASNRKDDYLRNRLRHHLIPLLKELQPAFNNIMSDNLSNVRFAEARYEERIHDLSRSLIRKKSHRTEIPISAVLEVEQPQALLHELLAHLGIRAGEPEKMLVTGKPGRTFLLDGHTVVRDRDSLIITNRSKPVDFDPIRILKTTRKATTSCGVATFRSTAHATGSEFRLAPHLLMVDAEKLKFPLILRRWQSGDRMQPLGMKRHKKVSDVLTDLKLSLVEKNETCVLVCGEEIVCIFGLRISDPFKVTASTRKALRIDWKPASND